MYNIIFYEDKNGKKEFEEYLFSLQEKANADNKDARINFNKIVAYLDALEELYSCTILQKRQKRPLSGNLNGQSIT